MSKRTRPSGTRLYGMTTLGATVKEAVLELSAIGVGESPPVVGFSPVGHSPVGLSPVGYSPVG